MRFNLLVTFESTSISASYNVKQREAVGCFLEIT